MINLNRNPKKEEFKNIKARLITDFTFSYFTLTAFFIVVFVLKYLSKFFSMPKSYFSFLVERRKNT
jgi:hypothetical protein